MNQHKTALTAIAFASLGISSIAALCTLSAQESVRVPAGRSTLEIPVSTGSSSKLVIPKNDAQSPPHDAYSQPSGWMSFDKCLVFAGETVDLPTQESGAISSLDVRENESVQANQIIAKLDGEIAKLEKEAAGLQARVAMSEAQDNSEIRLAQAFVEESKMQADLYEEMSAKGNASPTEYRQRQLAAKQAEVRLIQSNTAKQQRELKAQLAQSAVLLSQQKLDRLTLRSPIAGTITRIEHRPGEWIQSGTTVVKIIRLDEVRIDCFITEAQVDRIALIGKPVKITAKRGTSESLFSGRITSYDQEINAAGQIKVHATVQNQKVGDHWQLLPGMTVAMQLQKTQ